MDCKQGVARGQTGQFLSADETHAFWKQEWTWVTQGTDQERSDWVQGKASGAAWGRTDQTSGAAWERTAQEQGVASDRTYWVRGSAWEQTDHTRRIAW